MNLTLHYQLDGLADKPVLMLSNSLGSDLSMWDWLLPKLLPHFRILRYDTRGHGQSVVTPEPYTLEQLGTDVIDLLDAFQIDKAYFCGLSLGGLTGQWLGIYHPDRLHKLVVCNTAARVGTVDGWNERIEAVRQTGVVAMAPAILSRWITDGYKQTHPDVEHKLLAMIRRSPAEGYAACCAALRDADLRDQINQITLPTLVITGQYDPVTTVADGQFIGQEVPNALLVQLRSAHLSAVEAVDAFADVLLSFLNVPGMDVPGMDVSATDLFAIGMATRRSVLGDAHVDRANVNTTEFNADFQEFITRYAWGDIWTRPGLSRHSRSLITLAMLIALNRETEFIMHVRAAFNNGVTIDELREVIMQSALYCGLPAANAAFHAAQTVLNEQQP
jgi:3-oxoadipate enol-lactonase / 4-carboxymuconolactone decarboxylase